MADFQFTCTKCERVITISHGMKEPHPTFHANCGGFLRRKFLPTPVHYVHSGFYTTDKVLFEPEAE